LAAKSLARELEKLRDEIRRHEELYYILDSPEISDREYDQLMEHLQDLEKAHPELITPDSPTQRVGGRPAEGFPEVVHSRPMLSLDNSYNIDELRAFGERCLRLADGRAIEYVAELKIDGLSLALHYDGNVLVRGITRGDGRIAVCSRRSAGRRGGSVVCDAASRPALADVRPSRHRLLDW